MIVFLEWLLCNPMNNVNIVGDGNKITDGYGMERFLFLRSRPSKHRYYVGNFSMMYAHLLHSAFRCYYLPPGHTTYAPCANNWAESPDLQEQESLSE